MGAQDIITHLSGNTQDMVISYAISLSKILSSNQRE